MRKIKLLASLAKKIIAFTSLLTKLWHEIYRVFCVDTVVQVPGSQEVVARQRRAVERDGRRRRRRERRERGVGREKGEHRQGMSTDDELLEMNRLKFEKNMSE